MTQVFNFNRRTQTFTNCQAAATHPGALAACSFHDGGAARRGTAFGPNRRRGAVASGGCNATQLQRCLLRCSEAAMR